MEKKQNIKAINSYVFPDPCPGVNPRCLSALPSNIDDLIYIFKNQENQLGSDIQSLLEKKQK